MRVTRRLMLATMAASAAFSATAVGVLPPEAGRYSAATLRLRGLARYPESARAIGAIYRRSVPAEAEASTLARLLLSSLSLDESRLAQQPEGALRTLLADRVRADFAAGETADIDGWILSRTEARLCALWA